MSDGKRGFVLVLTLALLALLVLVVTAIATLGKVQSQIVTASAAQTQAKQNALLGIRVALGELQRTAAADSAVTGMAGIAGAAYAGGSGTASSRYRQWAGVWDGTTGEFVTWLASGASSGLAPGLRAGVTAITLAGTNSVGAHANDREQVDVGREPIAGVASNPAGASLALGGYAYWVGDEGVKVSAWPQPSWAARVTVDVTAMFPAAKPPVESRLADLLSPEQVKFLPGSALTDPERRPLFHTLTVDHVRLVSTDTREDGQINVNTTSETVWAAIFRAYNARKAAGDPEIGDVASAARSMRDGLAGSSGPGKAGNGPFLDASALLGSGILVTVLGTGTAARFRIVMDDLFTARSDTFRIRAYGDATNPWDATKVEASAYCEALVQRKDLGIPVGRKFVVLTFRWLTPDDI